MGAKFMFDMRCSICVYREVLLFSTRSARRSKIVRTTTV
jgi:hypothetical protein